MTGRGGPRPAAAGYGRRAVVAASAGGAAWAMLPQRAMAQRVPTGSDLVFDIIRSGSRIGQESLTFRQKGDQLTVEVEASIRVTMAMIPVYRLHHRETETWENNRIMSFAATTVKNGSNFYAQGWRVDGTFMARGTSQPETYEAPPHALPTSQWNHRMLNGPMINTENGKIMHPVVTDEGMTQVQLADGSLVQARHFNARGDLRFDTFFTESWEWVGLSFRGPDGSIVTYRKA